MANKTTANFRKTDYSEVGNKKRVQCRKEKVGLCLGITPNVELSGFVMIFQVVGIVFILVRRSKIFSNSLLDDLILILTNIINAEMFLFVTFLHLKRRTYCVEFWNRDR